MDEIKKTMIAPVFLFLFGLAGLFFAKYFVFTGESLKRAEIFLFGFLFFQFEVCVITLAMGTIFSMESGVFFNRAKFFSFLLVFFLFLLKISAAFFLLPFLVTMGSPLLLGCGALLSLFFSFGAFYIVFSKPEKPLFYRG